jgi:hypothetical protein
MSKGSRRRPEDADKFRNNYDRIFNPSYSIPDYGCLMTVEDFILQCRHVSFIDYDGSGYYSDGVNYFPLEDATPSDICKGIISKKRSHVIWFNK